MEGDEDDGEHDPGVRAKYLEENAVEEWTFNSRNGTNFSFSSFLDYKTIMIGQKCYIFYFCSFQNVNLLRLAKMLMKKHT